MTVFELSQPELVVLSRLVLKIPLPPLHLPSDPELDERSFEDVAREVLGKLDEKKWVGKDEQGRIQVAVPELASLLWSAGYLERWMAAVVQEKGGPLLQVGFYHDGNRVVRHEVDVASGIHRFQPGPEDMGYAWVWEKIARYTPVEQGKPEGKSVRFSLEVWETMMRARLEGRDASDEHPPQGDIPPKLWADALSAPLLLQLNCLCSVYSGAQDGLTLLVGPQRSWLLLPQQTAGETEQVFLWAHPATRRTIQQTLHSLWRALEPAPESAG